MSHSTAVEMLRGGLIVSCQAEPDEPLYSSHIMAAMARAAVLGGARGIRANTPPDIRAIRQVIEVPIIGIYKIEVPGYEVRITPTLEAASQVVEAGADIVALDATARSRPGGLSAGQLIQAVKTSLSVPVMADVSTFEEGQIAAEAGADLVATTLSGYTLYSRQADDCDLELVRALAHTLSIPVVAEGRIATPHEARQALEAGAYAVVVGAMITRPQQITRRFVEAIEAGPASPR